MSAAPSGGFRTTISPSSSASSSPGARRRGPRQRERFLPPVRPASPRCMDLALPAHVLRDRLRKRELSAAELLEAALARIAAVNPAVNAVVGLDAELARAAAAESDRRLAAGAARPLEGLPITIKDAFDEGLRSTAGAPAYKDRIPAVDAAPVARLR